MPHKPGRPESPDWMLRTDQHWHCSLAEKSLAATGIASDEPVFQILPWHIDPIEPKVICSSVIHKADMEEGMVEPRILPDLLSPSSILGLNTDCVCKAGFDQCLTNRFGHIALGEIKQRRNICSLLVWNH
ncbi:hypothetical protein PGT21_027666 [Puccinia graminis f. sp. tritici]|uniref:Uncharacterized protein n=1 Tax=Puccinia graminis f. sp. tritici TaxID=56615 RepID=A0A5B0QVM7_PUCGR|nr:hypothetical protein PGT21_027666 [Puccinia graminis f. sp. tritici]KAA1116975.1 hypothetical protein PGTUg99_032693 [Puccinia graminis f. sp. tritici]